MNLRDVAVVSFAQAPIVARDEHATAQEMLYPVIRQALANAGVERDAIEYQTAGSADYIDGRPFGFVASLDVMGSWPPREDSHLEMDASFAAYYAWMRIQAGDADTAMIVGYGKVSEGNPDRVSNIRFDPYYQAAIGLDETAASAMQASAYMAARGVSDRDLAEVAARNRASGAKNRLAQLRTAATADELARGEWAVEPFRKTYVPPIGESAVCLILAAAGKAERMCARPAWIKGVDQRAEMQSIGSRDLTKSASTALAAKRAYEMAGIGGAHEAQVVELAAANPVDEMILSDALGLDRRGNRGPVVNPSGGPLCGHPFMMTGLIRLGEVFLQLSGGAGEHAVAGARLGLAHATQGACLQHNLVWVLANEVRS
jgi:acetyl-CoA acetyltransferase